MWRACDLHNHTTPNEQDESAFDPGAFVTDCLAQGLDVVAVTDHDSTEHIADVQAAALGSRLAVVAGAEVSTDRGHVLCIAPDPQAGFEAVRELCDRLGVGAHPQQKSFADLVSVVRQGTRKGGDGFRDVVLLIGSHADQDGSLLGPRQPLAVEEQVRLAAQLDALEVVNDVTLQQWEMAGIKNSGVHLPLLRGSDSHVLAKRVIRSTWVHVPEISLEALSHALATAESSVRFDAPGVPPQMVIESVSFVGGLHDGMTFRFSERTNAIIGPPALRQVPHHRRSPLRVWADMPGR